MPSGREGFAATSARSDTLHAMFAPLRPKPRAHRFLSRANRPLPFGFMLKPTDNASRGATRTAA
eukprot:365085-Chlamydomonas_euryale.AAC.10